MPLKCNGLFDDEDKFWRYITANDFLVNCLAVNCTRKTCTSTSKPIKTNLPLSFLVFYLLVSSFLSLPLLSFFLYSFSFSVAFFPYFVSSFYTYIPLSFLSFYLCYSTVVDRFSPFHLSATSLWCTRILVLAISCRKSSTALQTNSKNRATFLQDVKTLIRRRLSVHANLMRHEEEVKWGEKLWRRAAQHHYR